MEAATRSWHFQSFQRNTLSRSGGRIEPFRSRRQVAAFQFALGGLACALLGEPVGDVLLPALRGADNRPVGTKTFHGYRTDVIAENTVANEHRDQGCPPG